MRSSNKIPKLRIVVKKDYIHRIMCQYEDNIITCLEYIEKLAYKNLLVKCFLLLLLLFRKFSFFIIKNLTNLIIKIDNIKK